MYNDEYENKGFPFRDFLLKLILVIIFVFLLVWLLPKFITPKIVNNNGDVIDLSPLTSQIFADNLDRMKDAAISYYTNERLPQKVGDYETMTLSEMIGKKIITPLIDKNNKACDVEASYVKITKLDDEYILKVNLKDSEKEDYILVHLGCYDYCDSYVCEKEEVHIKDAKPEEVFPNPSKSPKPTESQKPSPSPKPSPEPSPEPSPSPIVYEYEYKRTVGFEYGAWNKWEYSFVNNKPEKIDCSTKPITCSSNDPSCLLELKLLRRKERVGVYDKKYEKKKDVVVQTGSVPKRTCTNFNYIIIDNTTYVTTKETTYTTVTINKSGWTYAGRQSYKNPPSDSSTTQYVFVGADYSYCEETCTTLPNYYYDKYVYNSSLETVTNTSSTPGHTTSETDTTVTAECGGYVTEYVPIYGTITKSEIATRKEPLYGYVCYKVTRTRELEDPGKTSYKWSHYNDTSLLNDGWVYTGSKREKK